MKTWRTMIITMRRSMTRIKNKSKFTLAATLTRWTGSAFKIFVAANKVQIKLVAHSVGTI